MDWYYEEAGNRVGPVRPEDFNRLVGEGRIVPETLVWREGLPAWQPWRALAPKRRDTAVCCDCGRELPEEETIRLGASRVCAACKPGFFQRVKEGVQPLAARDHTAVPTEPLNPWFSIWVKPRATIQQIVDTDPRRLVLVLAAAQGILQTLDRASSRNLGDQISLPVILAIVLVAGPLFGWMSLFISSALVRWTGGWIGGRATGEHIRAALAWSGVPLVWALALWVPRLALFGQELFTRATPAMHASMPLLVLFGVFGAVRVVMAVWVLVIQLHCLGQVQGFSAWKALGNLMLAFAVVFVPLLLVLLAVLAVVFLVR